MGRVIEPEWLDTLSREDPLAVRARRDLRRINYWMRNFTLMEGMLRRLPRRPKRIVELGAGDGMFSLEVARRLRPRWSCIELVLLDREPAVARETKRALNGLGWKARTVETDVFEWLSKGQGADVFMANLFLHHFDDIQLGGMFRMAAGQSQAFAACEPRRNRRTLVGSRLVGLIGCGQVTRRDSILSVRAGFDGVELSALWPAEERWTLEERSGWVASHCFLAVS